MTLINSIFYLQKSFQNGILRIEMQGSCDGCPASGNTLKFGIEKLLKHYFPEISEVKNVNSIEEDEEQMNAYRKLIEQLEQDNKNR